VVFGLYGNLVNPANFAISSKVIQLIFELGMAVLILLVGGLVAIGYGTYRMCMAEQMRSKLVHINSEVINNKKSITSDKGITRYLSIIIDILSQRRYFRFFILILIAYGVLFSFVSQMIIFRPGVSLSHIYGVSIPSWNITSCCSFPGIVPFFTAYLSDNLIILVIPVNLVLATVISSLVGLNMALVLYIVQNNNNNNCRSKDTKNKFFRASGLAGSSGAATGLFTACPICAGTFFSTIVGMVAGGTTGVIGFPAVTPVSALQPFQILFIIASLSVLMLSSYLTVRRIKNTHLLKF
jgi:hypothetical protein